MNHITRSLHYPQSNGLAEKYVQIVKVLVLQNQGRRKRSLQVFEDLLQYPLSGRLQLPMQILQGRNSRSDLPMSNANRKQLGIEPEVIRNIDNHEVLPTYNLYEGQNVMYQDTVAM